MLISALNASMMDPIADCADRLPISRRRVETRQDHFRDFEQTAGVSRRGALRRYRCCGIARDRKGAFAGRRFRVNYGTALFLEGLANAVNHDGPRE